MTLVVDASVAIEACAVEGGWRVLDDDLAAPALMWSEARSVLHELVWRDEVEPEDAARALARLEAAPVGRHDPPELGDLAWRIADELGWARTYDAEYVALAQLLGCRLVTLDGRLRRGAARLGFVVSPTDL